eukprot:TRINITY_DN207_c6_g3_i3.p1 TRINITY_DN207_c6_g3~~TRINITY_DN207_c6_g3_i3.p1  ORF type:complete len:487 (+),score=185.05 TRINITY_DN207_c6_g3_i3:45-1505(+)
MAEEDKELLAMAQLDDGEELDDETREKLLEQKMQIQQEAEKTEEQRREEAKRRWKQFHYNPPLEEKDDMGEPTGKHVPQAQWAGGVFFFLLVICTINLVLTLDQWHGNHAWRKPFDLRPRDKRPGGWKQLNHSLRFSGAILGALGSLFCWVMRPSSDKYNCFAVLLVIASILLFCAFGFDISELTQAVELPYCQGINDMKRHKYVCEFEEYRATVILDIIAGILNVVVALVLCYQTSKGWVSRRMVYNENTSTFEKVVPNPDKPWFHTFPRAFRTFRPVTNFFSMLAGLTNLCLVGLGATQSTGVLLEPPGYDKPITNDGYNLPRTLYVITGTDAFRNGGWDEFNFLLRLSVNTVALVTIAFAIQWRRDGRLMQAWVILLGLVAGVIYMIAFAVDWEELAGVLDDGCPYENAKNHICVYHRYYATVIFDAFCGLLLILFNVRNCYIWLVQCRKPIEKEHVSYGWWCCGEWAAKKQEEEEERRRREG